ncbi:hypothetical protein BGZ59_001976 [Podila verticillata]|nr:hypothetical protein BGZ59_001976 [Podila verticillata]KFH66406.1 hypothetical protein MVEG_06931 [Podila verticillata NRRL 6337]
MVAFSSSRAIASFILSVLPSILLTQIASPSQAAKVPLADLSDVLEKVRNSTGLPGMSFAVLYKGKLIFAEGFGKRNDRDPFTVETVQPMGSLTKAFTAAAIGELVAEGKMDWDTTPIAHYLPEFELEDPILTSQLTNIDLLSHRVGMPNIDFGWYRTNTTRRELIKRLKYVKLDSKLRTTVQYSNVMYTVAGEAAANVAGTTYEKLVEEKILKPLGLENTGFGPIEMSKRFKNYAIPYNAASYEDAQMGKFITGYLDPVYLSEAPAGNIYSNVLDLVRWGRIIMQSGQVDGKQVLNKPSIDQLVIGYTFVTGSKRTPEFAPVQAYAMGWMPDSYKGKNYFWHDGGVFGYRSNLMIFPDDDLVIAHATNIKVAELMANVPFYIADELFGLPKTQDWLAVSARNSQAQYNELKTVRDGVFPKQIKGTSSSRNLEEYVGSYVNPVYGEGSVRLESGSLYFKYNVFDSKMEHYHYDSFKTELADFYIQMTQLATFVLGDDGRVAGFQMEVMGLLILFTKVAAPMA